MCDIKTSQGRQTKQHKIDKRKINKYIKAQREADLAAFKLSMFPSALEKEIRQWGKKC